jgi:hypothetical protein
VVSFLLAQSDTYGQRSSARFVLSMPPGGNADYLGLSIETVLRVLRKLRNDSLIEVNNARDIVIRDRASLRSLANDPHQHSTHRSGDAVRIARLNS